MDSMPSEPRILTIGHSTHSWDRFQDLLVGAGVTAVADVRTSPWSKHTPQFNRDALAERLRQAGLAYVFLGDALGGRPSSAHLFENGVANYQAMAAEPAFEAGLDRVRKGAETHVIALMCAEQEPLDCHRCLLVSRRLRASSLPVAHILSDGRIEAHQDTERRLLVCEGLDHDDIFESPAERLDRAYRQRAGKVAFAESASDAAALGTAG
jgi:uncharacterized protein (DUF488 family)